MSIGNRLTIDDIDVAGKRVLVRVDFNVPLSKTQTIDDDTRIRETLPTLRYLLENGAQSLVLMSHLGRPDGKKDPKSSLRPVAVRLEELLGKPVVFVEDCLSAFEVAKAPAKGTVILLENLRFYKEEEAVGVSKEDQEKFVSILGTYGDIYVNDAFGTAHRAHSSMMGLGKEVRASGYLLKKELTYFSQALEVPTRPYLGIMGGKKVSDKIKLIENLMNSIDEMIICGGMAYTFLYFMNGMKVGNSIMEKDAAATVEKVLEKAKQKNIKLHFPIDFVVTNDFKTHDQIKTVEASEGIPDGWEGLDCGPKTRKLFREIILNSRTLIMNGPPGVFEIEEFANGTREMIEAIVESTKEKGCVSIIGGGDSASAVAKLGYSKMVSHISTGGGASLELLEGKKLPGVLALSEKRN